VNNALMFSKASDEWSTPQALFDALHAEFNFMLDVAATADNAKCGPYFGPDNEVACWRDALDIPWAMVTEGGTLWMNPPYSKCREFMRKAAYEAEEGCTVVCLVPSRTDTQWFHAFVWDAEKHQPRQDVELRFLKGRVKFGGAKHGAPFPSVVIIFRGAR
jgi:phage N-6-adenine-methyltransferase